ncbi:hypothetical protein [Rhizorhabdus dicambivorans]|uniref:hypothetical protein n=1 Tax=Rhizorhabdus dicambivorans TaxID=1850238 RepID=UPI001596D1C4|nr:hypothetical protein [Rhizorhabdus dicambivorans]
MSGDRIVALVAIAAMLVLVVPGLARRGLPAQRIVKLALIWAVIFLAVTAAIMVLRATG